jgi:diguanylate cyclase (GGDEF)-like protein/PAS domain S-box-containing protein
MRGMPIQNTLQTAVQEVSYLSGDNYFLSLVEKLAVLVKADYTFISRLEAEDTLSQTLAVWGKGQLIANFSYDLSGTPCQDITSAGVCCFPSKISTQFPQDQMLIDMNIESYLGVALYDGESKVIGLLVALFEEEIELKDEDMLKDVLLVFSLRAAVEIERYTYEQQLKERIEQLESKNKELRIAQQIYDYTHDGIIVSDANNLITYVNHAIRTQSAYGHQELIGNNPKIISSGLHEKEFYDAMWEKIVDKGFWQGELLNRDKNGRIFPVLTSISSIPGADGQAVNYVAIYRDISDQKEAQQLISYQASHDQLTSLYNRYEFKGRLKQRLVHANRQNEKGALLFLDVDNFKLINDTLGHIAGDILLKKIGQRLKDNLRDDDLLARLGGDEFSIFATVDDCKTVDILANKVLMLFNDPFELDKGREVRVTTSIGICLYPSDTQDPDELLASADQALYSAKDYGRNNFSYFTNELRAKAFREQHVQQRLQLAIENELLDVHLQPIVDVATGEISHLEALARWHDAELGQVFPDEFIAVAEHSGMIRRLGLQIAKKAIIYTQRLSERLSKPLQVSINRSALEFELLNDESDPLFELVAQLGFDPSCLCIEVTESLMLKNPEMAEASLRRLRKHGFSLSMDDFGKGYSSLSYLKHFTFNSLKVDRSFVEEINKHKDDFILVKTIIEMAHNFGMKTIIEGVETQVQLDVVQKLGCDYVQGYLLTPALDFDNISAYLKTYNPQAYGF